jgi:hypothetical protein
MDLHAKDSQNFEVAIESGWKDRFYESIEASEEAMARPDVLNDVNKKEALQMRVKLLQALLQASRIGHFLSLGAEEDGSINKTIIQMAPLDFQSGIVQTTGEAYNLLLHQLHHIENEVIRRARLQQAVIDAHVNMVARRADAVVQEPVQVPAPQAQVQPPSPGPSDVVSEFPPVDSVAPEEPPAMMRQRPRPSAQYQYQQQQQQQHQDQASGTCVLQ